MKDGFSVNQHSKNVKCIKLSTKLQNEGLCEKKPKISNRDITIRGRIFPDGAGGVCVCVCERERERERGGGIQFNSEHWS